MPKIFDTQTRQEVTLPEGDVNQAILSGTHSFAANDVVPVRDSNGEAYSLPASQVRQALGMGFSIETPKQTAVREYVKDNEGLSGSVKVALGQFANQALFDVPQTEQNFANPLEAQKWEALKADHQLSNAIGGVAGFGTSLLYGGPVIDAAGQGAERLITENLAQYGIKRGAESISKDIAARIAENAGRLGVEAAAFATPQAATDAFNGDPELAAETLLANGAFGMGLGTLGALTGKGIETLKKAFPTSQLAGDALDASKAASQIKPDESLAATLTGKTPEDIAYSKANIKRMEATPSLDESVENSVPKMFQQDFEKFQNETLPNIEKKVSGILEKSDVTINTQTIGEKIDKIVSEIAANEGPTEQAEKAIDRLKAYKERLIPVDEEGIPQYKDLNGKQVRKYLQGLRKDNSAFRKLNSPLGGDFTLPETSLMDLSEGISEDLKNQVGPQYRATMEDYAKKVKLSNALEKQLSVNNAFQNRVKKPIQDALSGYSTLSFNPKQTNWYKNLEDFSKEAGKDYPTMVKDRLVYSRMFPDRALQGDSVTLTSKLGGLLDKAHDFGEAPVKTVASVFLPKSEDLLHAYVSNGKLFQATQKTLKTLSEIPERMKNMISKKVPVSIETSSVGAIGRFLGNDAPKNRKEQLTVMNQKLSEFTQNAALSTDHLSQITKPLQPNLALSVTAKNVAIAKYLEETIPKPKTPPSPFNPYAWEPSAHELSQFERRVHVISNPMSVIDHLENGSLTKEEVETAQTLFPKLYSQIQNKVVDALTDSEKPVPYGARIKLSLLMGQPFDNSLNGQVIAAYQANFGKVDQAAQAQGVQMPSMQTNIEKISTS